MKTTLKQSVFNTPECLIDEKWPKLEEEETKGIGHEALWKELNIVIHLLPTQPPHELVGHSYHC